MPNYTVTDINGKREFTTKQGHPLVSYKLMLTGDDGFSGAAELSQKPETPAPTNGQVIEGTLDKSNPQFPPKLKKAQQAQGGPPRGKGKQDDAAIARAVAYKGAVELTASMSQPDPEQIEHWVERFFNHGLKLLEGKPVPPPATSEPAEPGPTREDLVKAYEKWSNIKQATGVSSADAQAEFKLKQTALGIQSIDTATPAQLLELRAFLTDSV